MATEKETIILDFQVEQGDAISELEKTKKSIIQLKEEQKELNKAYKQGDVTLEEYASESVRLEAILKKQQSTYNNVQKSVTGVKTQLDKLIDSNKKISTEFQNAANKINIAGVSVGDLTTKIASFANPATAAVGIVTALGAAYARSTIGAKDLEFAQNQLAFATTFLTDKFASFISSSEDGEGAVSKILNAVIAQVDLTTAAVSKIAALAEEELEQVQRDQQLAQVAINERLAENSELLTEISNAETTIAEKKQFAAKLEDNITQNANERLALVNREIDATEKLIIDVEQKEFQLNKLYAERSNIQRQETKQLEKVEKQLNSIINAENKRIANQQAVNEEIESEFQRRKRIRDLEQKDAKSVEERALAQADGLSNDPIVKGLKTLKKVEREKRKENDETTENFVANEYIKLDALSTVSAQAAVLFEEGSNAYKALSIATTFIDTYKAATAALAPPPTGLGPVFGPALAAVTIATGLANIAKISSTGFAEGGFTGHGEKYQPAGVVHKGEVVWSQADVAMAGGASRVDSMRPTYPRRSRNRGYADGGAVVADATSGANQAFALANSLKMMPQPVVSVKEITKVQKRVTVKQNISRQ